MKSFHNILLLLILPVGLIFFPQQILANGKTLLSKLSASQGNLELFGIDIHPGLSADYMWDDNVHYEPNDKDEEHISVISPGILFSGGDNYSFTLGFAYDRNIYSDNSDESFDARHGLADISLNLPWGLRVNLNDTYMRTKLPKDDADSPQRAGYMNNKGGGGIGYTTPSGKLSVDVSFLSDKVQYDQDVNSSYNRRSDEGGLAFSYKFMPKTSFLFNVGGGKNNYYDRNRDDLNSQTQLINGGILWELTSRMNVSFVGGWRKIIMKGEDFGNAEMDTFNANFLWELNSIIDMDIGLSRDFFNSEYLGNASESLSSSAYYKKNKINMGFGYKPRYNVKLHLHGNYESRNYVKLDNTLKARKDTVTSGGLSIRYDFQKWIHFTLDFNRTKVLSNDDNRDYNKNIVSFSTGMVF